MIPDPTPTSTQAAPRGWIAAATDRAIFVRSLVTCLVVGGILTAINQGDHLVRGEVDAGIALKIGLTFVIPFCVATLSAAAAVRSRSSRRSG